MSTDTHFWTEPYYGVSHLLTEKMGKSIKFGVITVVEYDGGNTKLYVFGSIGSMLHIEESYTTVERAKAEGERHARQMGLLEWKEPLQPLKDNFAIVRRACLIEDEGREEFVMKVHTLKEAQDWFVMKVHTLKEAQDWIAAQENRYFKPNDYTIYQEV